MKCSGTLASWKVLFGRSANWFDLICPYRFVCDWLIDWLLRWCVWSWKSNNVEKCFSALICICFLFLFFYLRSTAVLLIWFLFVHWAAMLSVNYPLLAALRMSYDILDYFKLIFANGNLIICITLLYFIFETLISHLASQSESVTFLTHTLTPSFIHGICIIWWKFIDYWRSKSTNRQPHRANTQITNNNNNIKLYAKLSQ